MKILLINPPRRFDSFHFPPTNLLYISQAAKRAGHQAEIIDIPYLLDRYPEKYSLTDDSIFQLILNEKEYDIIGLGGVVSTYFFYDYFIKRFRQEKKDIPIIIGGTVGVPIKDVWLEHNPADYLVEGCGELVIQRVLDALEIKNFDAIEKIPGLHFLKNGKYQSNPQELIKPLDQIPFLDYDEIDPEYFIRELTKWIEDIIPKRKLLEVEELRFLPFFTSRGCPYKCTFCFHFNDAHLGHSVDYVVENAKFLKKKYNINGLYIIDDLFICNKAWVKELCIALEKADLGIYFVAGGGKPSLVTPDIATHMKKAGFVRFSFGIETGSQKMLDIMKKKTTVQQNLDALVMTEKCGLPCFANIMFGMPGENLETMNETRDLLIKADLSTKRFFSALAVAYPGTPLFKWMKEEGLVKDTYKYLFEVGSIGKYVYNFTDLSYGDLMQRIAEILLEVDIVYHFKHKEFVPLLVKSMRWFISRLLYKIHPNLRMMVAKWYRKAFPIKVKRSSKRSNDQVDAWIEQLKASGEWNG